MAQSSSFCNRRREDIPSLVTSRCLKAEPLPLDYLHEQHNEARQNSLISWCGAWSPDGSLFAWSAGNSLVHLVPWDAEKLRPVTDDAERPIRTIVTSADVQSVGFTAAAPCERARKAKLRYRRFHLAGHTVLAVGLANGTIQPYDVCCIEHSQLGPLKDHTKSVTALSFSPNGSCVLISSSLDGTCKVWDLHDDGNMGQELRVPGCQGFCDVAWSPRADLVATVGSENTAAVWCMRGDLRQGKLRHRLRGHVNTVVSCRFTPDGAVLATASHDTRVILWNPYTGARLAALGNSESRLELNHLNPPPGLLKAGGFNNHYVNCLAMSPDGLRIATTCDDKYVRVWDLREPRDPAFVGELSDFTTTFCRFSEDGRSLAVGTRRGDVYFFDVPCVLSSLHHICRKMIRQRIRNNDVSQLFDTSCPQLPATLYSYLEYQAF